MKDVVRQVALWDAIHRYVRTCGGNAGVDVYGNTSRQEAVVEIEKIVFDPEEEYDGNEFLDAIQEAIKHLNKMGAPEPRTRDSYVKQLGFSLGWLEAELARIRKFNLEACAWVVQHKVSIPDAESIALILKEAERARELHGSSMEGFEDNRRLRVRTSRAKLRREIHVNYYCSSCDFCASVGSCESACRGRRALQLLGANLAVAASLTTAWRCGRYHLPLNASIDFAKCAPQKIVLCDDMGVPVGDVEPILLCKRCFP